jgi:hypothetical protein
MASTRASHRCLWHASTAHQRRCVMSRDQRGTCQPTGVGMAVALKWTSRLLDLTAVPADGRGARGGERRSDAIDVVRGSHGCAGHPEGQCLLKCCSACVAREMFAMVQTSCTMLSSADAQGDGGGVAYWQPDRCGRLPHGSTECRVIRVPC